MLEWEDPPRNVVVAADQEIAGKIIENLTHLEPFNDENKWSFEIADNAQALLNYAGEPDVLLVSRFFPGMDPRALLQGLKKAFPEAHVVLMVGELNEQTRVYMRNARQEGYENFVLGKLPGTRPYTLPVAIRKSYLEVTGWDQTTADNGKPVQGEPGQSKRSVTVMVTGVKGGVGKTTVGVGTAMCLAGTGLTVTAVDIDYSRQDMCTFFGVEPRFGCMEDLIVQDRVSAAQVSEILVRVANRPGIQVLPGSPNKMTPASSASDQTMLALLPALTGTAQVVIFDTPPSFSSRWTPVLLPQIDVVLAVVDQSMFSGQDLGIFGQFLAACGVTPGKVKLVVNRFSKKLPAVRKIEKAFAAGMGVRNIAVTAVIPDDWEQFGADFFRRKISGLDSPKGPWSRISAEVAALVGNSPKPSRKRR